MAVDERQIAGRAELERRLPEEDRRSSSRSRGSFSAVAGKNRRILMKSTITLLAALALPFAVSTAAIAAEPHTDSADVKKPAAKAEEKAPAKADEKAGAKAGEKAPAKAPAKATEKSGEKPSEGKAEEKHPAK